MATFRIERGGRGGTMARVVAGERLDGDDFRRIAQDLGTPPVRARKHGKIIARQSAGAERIGTRWNGQESVADAAAGDWIVTGLGRDGAPLRDRDGSTNTYVIGQARFPELYERLSADDGRGAVFRPKGVVEAIRLEGGFEIMAPWGELQRAADGWLLLNGTEVYGNHRDTFAETYDIVG